MVQGQKKTKSVLASKAASKTKEAHRGMRIAPKATGIIKQKSIQKGHAIIIWVIKAEYTYTQTIMLHGPKQKKLASTNIKNTESLMASRAGATGKLTILKGIADKATDKAKAKKSHGK
ncbi:hypothetical protein BSLG_010550 [Batrachochytrium salamandrivorans]|nr:hypothetical protein BSLG_010550 [Batrachochytrium salamandrivorans]